MLVQRTSFRAHDQRLLRNHDLNIGAESPSTSVNCDSGFFCRQFKRFPRKASPPAFRKQPTGIERAPTSLANERKGTS